MRSKSEAGASFKEAREGEELPVALARRVAALGRTALPERASRELEDILDTIDAAASAGAEYGPDTCQPLFEAAFGFIETYKDSAAYQTKKNVWPFIMAMEVCMSAVESCHELAPVVYQGFLRLEGDRSVNRYLRRELKQSILNMKKNYLPENYVPEMPPEADEAQPAPAPDTPRLTGWPTTGIGRA